MHDGTDAPALIALALPCGIAVAGLLLLPAVIPSLARPQAAKITLATLLLSLLAGALLLHRPLTDLPAAQCASVAVVMVAALAIAAPLLDRARALGLTVAAAAGGGVSLWAAPLAAAQAPGATALLPLYFPLLTALLIGAAGSALLPMGPLRHAGGSLRAQWGQQGRLLTGWALLAAMGVALALRWDTSLALLPVITAACVAGLVAVFTAAGEDALQKAGEALCAGALLALPAHATPEMAALLGVAAAFFATRSEAITQALRLDDPLHSTGALLLPAAFGLLTPALHDLSLLAPGLRALGVALLSAVAISVILWPAAMLIFGIALPPRLAREGVRR